MFPIGCFGSTGRFLSTPSARRATSEATGPSRISTHDFYPRPPRGGRQKGQTLQQSTKQFLSTPSARRATQARTPSTRRPTHFYPRPPRGGRPFLLTYCATYAYISIHALREEGDHPRLLPVLPCPVISIHALREEGDPRKSTQSNSNVYFYPRPPRGGRHPVNEDGEAVIEFLSTPSARRATHAGVLRVLLQQISIHALREEGDKRAEH